MMINPTYAARILDIANALIERNIPCTINTIWDGLQIRFPWNNGDIVCHNFSLGHDLGAVESYHCPWDDDDEEVSSIRPDDAISYIANWYDSIHTH